MTRLFLAIGSVCCTLPFLGCASTWDNVSGQKFRTDITKRPLKTMFGGEDEPMEVLRNKVEGGERASAFRRLEEPAQNGRLPAEQDEALEMLGKAATTEPSPIVRTAAIDALGRFKDPRAVRLLVAAYNQAETPMAVTAKPEPSVNPISDSLVQAGKNNNRSYDATGLTAPTGFPPEFVSTIRTKAIFALAETNNPEAVNFLGEIAMRKADTTDDMRDVRIAAVRGLTVMRQKESVKMLSQVLASEKGKDVAILSRTHEGLVQLTGKNLPPDPEQWSKVVQAGVEVVPEKNMLERAIYSVTP